MSRRFSIIVLVVGTIAISLVHGPILGYRAFANVDEAYAMALAERLLEGHKLYAGAISQRGPLMYYAFEGIAWLHGWDNVVAVRAYALLLCVAHLLLVYWAGLRLLSRTVATVAAGLSAYALSFGLPPMDGVALHGETLQMPALLFAVVYGGLAVRDAPSSRARRLKLLVAGLAFGIAMSIKQSAALHPLPVIAWLALDARRRGQRHVVVADAAVLIAAVVVVPTLFVLHAWLQGTLPQLYYYTAVYNRDVHLRPTTERFAWLPFFFFGVGTQTSFVMLLFLLTGRGLPFVVRRLAAARRLRSLRALGRAFGPKQYVVLHLVLALAAASAMYRFFPHYFIQVLPFLALATGAAVERFFRGRRPAWTARTVLAAFMCFTLFTGALGCVFGEKVDGRVGHDRLVQDVSRYIDATTAKNDRIFVWGFSSWIYPYSHRRPAGRYVFHTYVTGFVPWFWEKLPVERARIVPGSVDALLSDLERERPSVIVDAGSVMMARPIRMYPAFNELLHREFCFEVRLGAYDIYRRKPAEGCAVPYFPRVAMSQDWNGRGIAIPIPRTIDWDESPHLPFGNYFKPVWFTNGPPPPKAGLEAVRDLKREREEQEGLKEGFVVFDLEPDSVILPPVKRDNLPAPP